LHIGEEKRPQALLWFFTVAALFFLLGMEPMTGTERVYAQIMQKILQQNDLFFPIMDSGSETPLWFLWSGAAALGLGPRSWSAFLMRLPSALAALAALAVTMRLARREYGERTAMLTGWMVAGSCVFLSIGRMGVPLMTVTAVSILTVALFFLDRDPSDHGRFYRFWLLFFCGAWAGGLSTQCAVLMFLLPFCGLRRVRRKLLSWHHFFAFVLGCAIYFVPLMLAKYSGSWGQWRAFVAKELARDFAESTPLRTPSADLWFYCLLPFFVLQIAALWAAVLRWRKLRRMTWLWGLGLLLTVGYWSVLPEEGAAPALLLPCGAIFFAAVLDSPAFAGCRRTILGWTRILAILTAAMFFCSLCFFVFGDEMLRLELLAPSAFRVAGCGLLGLLVMAVDEWRPAFWSRVCGLPRDLAAQFLCLALLTSGILCWVLPMIPKSNP